MEYFTRFIQKKFEIPELWRTVATIPSASVSLQLQCNIFKPGTIFMRNLNSLVHSLLFWLVNYLLNLNFFELFFKYIVYIWRICRTDGQKTFQYKEMNHNPESIELKLFIEAAENEDQRCVCISTLLHLAQREGIYEPHSVSKTRKKWKPLQEVSLNATAFSIQFQENRVIWSLKSYWNSYRK